MHENLQDHYGRQLQRNEGLRASACCDRTIPGVLRPLLFPNETEMDSAAGGVC
jgi:hypothetical protein